MPSASVAWATTAAICSASVTSRAIGSHDAARWRRSRRRARSRRSARRAVTTTEAPAAASVRAKRRPSPELAPVTRATRPLEVGRRVGEREVRGCTPASVAELPVLTAVKATDGRETAEYGNPRVRGGRARRGRWRRRRRPGSTARCRRRPASGRSGRAGRGRPRRGGSPTRTGTAPGPTPRRAAPTSSNGYGVKRSWAAACSDGRRSNSASRGSERCQIDTAWSRRRSIDGTQPAPISMTPPRSVGWRSSTPSSTSTDTNRSAGW